MKNIVNTYIDKFRNEKRTRTRIISALTVLALVVSGTVFWQLHSTGVAMANETYCGMEEHIHSEEAGCYERVLTCGFDGEYGTGIAESESGVEGFAGEEAAEAETEPDNESPEADTEDLTEAESVEAEPDHESPESEKESAAETEVHVHDESCYELVLVCDIPEHTHSVECMIDETADVEKAEDWEATLPELTGIWADDVVAVAQSQVGYTESEKNFQFAEDSTTHQGYTRYGAWYGNEYGDWDAMFVSFVLHYAGVSEEEFPEASGAYAWIASLKEMDLYADASDYEPIPGDLVFIDTDGNEEAETTGIVTDIDGEVLIVIQGDCDDAVCENEYKLNDEQIVGYGIIPENQEERIDEDEGETEKTEETDEFTILTFEGEDYIIEVAYGPDAELPDDVVLYAYEYAQDSETYQSRCVEAAEFYGWEDAEDEQDEKNGSTDIRLFNIGLYVYRTSEDAEESKESGEWINIEPAAPVTVTITCMTNENSTASYTITHFGDEIESVDSEITRDEEGYSRIAFDLDGFSDIMVMAWSGSASGKVVLNLGNGNGNHNFADYNGYDFKKYDKEVGDEGTYLRYTTAFLDDYAESDGSLTIHLPSNSDLNSTFTVVDTTDGLSAVTVALGKELAYDYTLVGWVNIATGEYYDVSDGAITAEIDLNNENVFYADWIAASYDNHDSGNDNLLRNDVVSTASFVDIEMFDYNELFNLYSASVEQSGTDSETWSDSRSLHSTLLGKGTGDVTITGSFVFNNDGTTAGNNTNGILEYLSNRTDGNIWTGTPNNSSKKYVIDSASTWNITKRDDTILGLLFDKNNADNVVGVNYVGTADNLFWVDKDGYYTYDSAESAAVYDKTTERFYVYNQPQYVTGKNRACFLPYNSYSSGSSGNTNYSVYNGSVDYWFGMKMDVSFYLPSATDPTGTSKGNQVNGEDMVFNFSGDDDIWIFVDDQLVLDMAGIHDLAYGSIDFTSGTVTIGMSRNEDGVIDTTYGSTDTVSISAGNHTLTVYYMERGGWESNLEIQFNVVPLWEYETGPVQTVTSEKTWVDAQGNVIEDPTGISNVCSSVEVGLFDVLSSPEDAETTGMKYTVENDGTYTFDYTDDADVEHIFAYDPQNNTLTYTEVENGETSTCMVFSDKDADGRVLDTNGNVVCWYEEDTKLLHMRMDVQTLNAENDWYYAWELLDANGEYEVLELSGSSSYTTSSESENLTTYNYWSVVGDAEIEAGMLDGQHPVILTEAAQEANDTLGDTSEALGWVIVGAVGNVATKQVKFSQIATLEEIKDTSGAVLSYLGTYGVTSQSEIDSLGPGALWYMVDSGNKEEDIGESEVEGFYLHCELDGTNYYLTLTSDEHSLTLTTQEERESEFYYDSLGELMVVVSSGEAVRVEIKEDGTINIDQAESSAALDDVRIYTLQETATSGFSFTAVNTFLPDITVEKVDSTTNEPLEGVSFTLNNENGLYYAGLNDSNEVIWYNPDATSVGYEDIPDYEFKTNVYGSIIFNYLPDGTYTLTEVAAPDGYDMLPSSIKIVIEDGTIESTTGDKSVSWTNDTDADIDDYVHVNTDDGITITVSNHPGVKLPMTGGIGTWLYTMAGLLLTCSAAYLLYNRVRRERYYA